MLQELGPVDAVLGQLGHHTTRHPLDRLAVRVVPKDRQDRAAGPRFAEHPRGPLGLTADGLHGPAAASHEDRVASKRLDHLDHWLADSCLEQSAARGAPVGQSPNGESADPADLLIRGEALQARHHDLGHPHLHPLVGMRVLDARHARLEDRPIFGMGLEDLEDQVADATPQ